MRRSTISLVVSRLLMATFALQGHAATLAWKFSPGDVENYRLTQSSRLSGGAEGVDKQIASVEQVLDLNWKVLEVSNAGDATIALQVTAFSLLVKGPDGQEVRYDSESTEELQGYAAMLAPIGKRLAESPIVFRMNSRGEVTNIELADALAEAVKAVPGGKKFAKDGGIASIEAMARLGAPVELPEGEVASGQSWSAQREVVIPALAPTKVEFEYKIADPLAENEITIEQQMKLVAAEDEQSVELADQKSSGTVVWNSKSGRPETSLLNYEVEIEQPESTDGPLKLDLLTEFRRIADETQ